MAKKKEDTEKKVTTKKTTPKKTTKKTTTTPEKKVEVIEKPKKKKYKWYPQDQTDLLLVVIFIAFLSLTVFLGFKAKVAKDDLKEHVRANIVIPVLGKGTSSDLSVDVANMKKGQEKEYIFKVSNSKDDNVNPEEVLYNVYFGYDRSISLEVTKNEGTENILAKDKTIKNNTLQKDEKQEDIYRVKIKAKKNTKNKQLVNISVKS